MFFQCITRISLKCFTRIPLQSLQECLCNILNKNITKYYQRYQILLLLFSLKIFAKRFNKNTYSLCHDNIAAMLKNYFKYLKILKKYLKPFLPKYFDVNFMNTPRKF